MGILILKKWYVRFLLYFLVLIIGIILVTWGNYPESRHTWPQPKLGTPSLVVETYRGDASSTKASVEICDAIFDKRDVADCYVEQAIATKNLSICNLLEPFSRDVYFGRTPEYCFREVAVASRDKKICDLAGSLKNVCLGDIGIKDIYP